MNLSWEPSPSSLFPKMLRISGKDPRSWQHTKPGFAKPEPESLSARKGQHSRAKGKQLLDKTLLKVMDSFSPILKGMDSSSPILKGMDSFPPFSLWNEIIPTMDLVSLPGFAALSLLDTLDRVTALPCPGDNCASARDMGNSPSSRAGEFHCPSARALLSSLARSSSISLALLDPCIPQILLWQDFSISTLPHPETRLGLYPSSWQQKCVPSGPVEDILKELLVVFSSERALQQLKFLPGSSILILHFLSLLMRVLLLLFPQ